VTRQQIQTNARLQFSTANESFHPIESIGRNQINVPSLITSWMMTSQIDCTDCHNSDSSPATGGSGPNGPHGSIYPPILERNLVFADFQPENAATYALCYKCHSHSIVLSSASFPLHQSHVVHDLPRFARRGQHGAPHQFQHHLRHGVVQWPAPIQQHRHDARELHAHLSRTRPPGRAVLNRLNC
jgi:hypothetical protein